MKLDKNPFIDDLLGVNGFGAKLDAIEDVMQAIDLSLNPLEVSLTEQENIRNYDLSDEILIEDETIFHVDSVN